jgi:MFS family permease
VIGFALFRRSAFTGSALAVFMSRVLSIGGTVYFVQYLQGALHLGATTAGLMLVPVFVAQIVAGMVTGKLLSRFHPGHVVAFGCLCKAVGAAVLTCSAVLAVLTMAVVLAMLSRRALARYGERSEPIGGRPA